MFSVVMISLFVSQVNVVRTESEWSIPGPAVFLAPSVSRSSQLSSAQLSGVEWWWRYRPLSQSAQSRLCCLPVTRVSHPGQLSSHPHHHQQPSTTTALRARPGLPHSIFQNDNKPSGITSSRDWPPVSLEETGVVPTQLRPSSSTVAVTHSGYQRKHSHFFSLSSPLLLQ